MIVAENLTRTYEMGKVTVHALQGVSLTILKGEFVGIMGASGSGKSTLLHLLGLLDKPTEGKILLGGIDVKTLNDRQRTRFRLKRLGYVFQDYALVPELTVEENVYLTSMIRGTSKEEYQRQTLQILDRIGLSDRLTHKHNELSGGQQQRVAIARAMVNKPEILFADEPCANLDSESSRNVLDLFKQINKEMSQTIVMVSHEDWHMEYFDRVIILRDGKIVSDGPPPDEILERACKYGV
ncbi:ABC transporter ATP-binding protein [Methanospirillum sp. J.3.6.1-F.2.7.3]|jgi:putative ABC transport system ATP-binding protein|uniref:ABC transporter ATP-binding protein n=2 Tax=Methanospirillum TaxID=2202 RepID=A0A8E7EFV8_9EURY|nr:MULTISPECIES: ABC transporter ATP-binding protein [Methanospirillum]MDX8551665.1 ABC transporter ATP-binding protein [Methanospirillum hungatei]NLW75581.1 ABC transporter ATP-binding protein [Methanomicrobiales archaeon]QVV87658.1 ABC transporter ATP-binding protein [Methanospirillum sp. J.3.6.1-F.2.7.3]QXO95212.1 ABC transporter ATP-binding protein [Methanospirillum hungatei]